jgi:hypothetical protein
LLRILKARAFILARRSGTLRRTPKNIIRYAERGFGVKAGIPGLLEYSGGFGITITSGQVGLYVTGSGGYSPGSNLDYFGASPYGSINMIDNLTKNPNSLDAYNGGGINTGVTIGNIGFNFGQPADFNTAVTSGPFAPTKNGGYNSYGITVTPFGEGIGASRNPTYTYFPLTIKF